MDRQQWQSNTEYKSHKATNGPLDGHKGPRLYGNRNQQRRLCSAPACARTRWSLAPTLTLQNVWPPSVEPFYPKLVHFYRFHKARKREVNLRSASKSTPDPPDACSNERAQTSWPEAAGTWALWPCFSPAPSAPAARREGRPSTVASCPSSLARLR